VFGTNTLDCSVICGESHITGSPRGDPRKIVGAKNFVF
jgi:hypothetical protein